MYYIYVNYCLELFLAFWELKEKMCINDSSNDWITSEVI